MPHPLPILYNAYPTPYWEKYHAAFEKLPLLKDGERGDYVGVSAMAIRPTANLMLITEFSFLYHYDDEWYQEDSFLEGYKKAKDKDSFLKLNDALQKLRIVEIPDDAWGMEWSTSQQGKTDPKQITLFHDMIAFTEGPAGRTVTFDTFAKRSRIFLTPYKGTSSHEIMETRGLNRPYLENYIAYEAANTFGDYLAKKDNPDKADFADFSHSCL